MADNLYCPRCSNQFSDGTSYCRSCGLSLDAVSKIVNGEAETAPEITTRPNFKLMRLGVGLFILGLVIGLINGALRDFALYPDSYGKMLFMVIVAAGMLMLGAGFVFPTKKYKKRKVAVTADQDAQVKLDTSPLVGKLEEARFSANDIDFPTSDREKVPVGSVTEHTTRNLN
ncbi:MAG: ECF transporter S component [Acidobacteria bacterium]|nr:ECF transporter S component [Acidobacteriota bacterium]